MTREKGHLAIILLILLLWLSGWPAPAHAAQFAGGTGESYDPYLIAATGHLEALAYDSSKWGSHFKLTANLDLSGITLGPIGTWRQPFSGVFDGNGHILSHFTSEAGMFDSVGPTGVIRNLGLADMRVSDEYSSCIGGLANYNEGAIVGCFATGVCDGDWTVGGLVGENRGEVFRCYSNVEVSGEWDVGGLVGRHEGILAECYATGRVTASDEETVGGLVGRSWGGRIDHCFWDAQTSNQPAGDNGEGKATSQMKDMKTFQNAGWDFIFANDGSDDAWAMPPGGGYPILWWQAQSLPPLQAFGGGTGTPDDPYLVATAEDLNKIGSNPRLMDRSYKLVSDINMTAPTSRSIGGGRDVFTGTFDGGGHLITNWKADSQSYSVALFTHVGNGGSVSCLGMTGVNVPQGDYAAALAGMNGGTIASCFATGRVCGDLMSGGLVACNAGIIACCYSEVAVAGIHLYSTWAGGLVGCNSGTIEDSYATGKTSGSSTGGLVGSNTGLIRRSYAASANPYTSCDPTSWNHAECATSAGLVRENMGTVLNCYWDIDVSGQTISEGGIGRHTAALKRQATFLGWNSFDSAGAWTCDEGVDYPRLSWESRAAQPLPPQRFEDLVTGYGTTYDPYLIATPEQFDSIGLFPSEWDKYFVLIADVDLSDHSVFRCERIGYDATHAFTGVFEGNGHQIRGWAHTTMCDNVGVFGCIGSTGSVMNLRLDDCTVTGRNAVAALAGVNAGTIINCHVAASVRNARDAAGVLVGRNDAGMIALCSAKGDCNGVSNLGGLVGVLQNGQVVCCSADVAVAGKEGDSWLPEILGGLIGCNRGIVIYSYSAGRVCGYDGIGGLIGINEGVVQNCYSIATVRGEYDVGGLIGVWQEGRISMCYAAGSVTGGYDHYACGGLVGSNWYGSDDLLLNSFWDITATGQTVSDGGVGKPTSQMQTASTFKSAGWDFDHVWTIAEGQDYPRLRWE